MSMIDVESLLTEITPDKPSGDDMEYDQAFIDLMEAVEGTSGQQMGDTYIEGVEPDWKKAQSLATELFGRTKDVRVNVYLIQALIKMQAYAGLSAGVLLLERLLSRYWDTLHPMLDPDDNDPTMRINVIAALADYDAIINPIRSAPLVSSKVMGQFSLRDMEIAKGIIALPENYDGAAPDIASVNAAFMEVELEALQQTKADIESCVAALKNIDAFLLDKVGSYAVLDLKNLYVVLADADKIVSEYLANRGVVDAADVVATEESADTGQTLHQPTLTGQINHPKDVLAALDKIIHYYQRSEPSSPIPVMLQRVKGWVSMDFFAILEDIAPDGMKQAQTVVGEFKAAEANASSDAAKANKDTSSSSKTSNW